MIGTRCSDKGLYFLDTRVLSSWAIYANGEPWELLNGGAITHYASRIALTNRAIATQSGAIPARTLGLTISRWIDGGMHEDRDVTNNSMKPIEFQLEIAIRSVARLHPLHAERRRATVCGAA
jgi:hypothetical protein